MFYNMAIYFENILLAFLGKKAVEPCLAMAE